MYWLYEGAGRGVGVKLCSYWYGVVVYVCDGNGWCVCVCADPMVYMAAMRVPLGALVRSRGRCWSC